MKTLICFLSGLLAFLTAKLFRADANPAGFAILTTVALLWILAPVPLPVTSLAVPVLAVALGIMSVREAFAPFSHPVIFLFLSGLAFAVAFQKHKIPEFVSYLVLKTARTPKGVFAVFLATSALLSMWMTNTSTTAMLLPLALSAPVPRKDLLLLGIAYMSSIGGTATLIGTPPNAIAGAYLDMTFASWLRYGIPSALAMGTATVLLMSFQVKGKAETLSEKPTELSENPKLSPQAVRVLLIFALVCVGWTISSVLPKGSDAIVGLAGVFLLSALGLFDITDLSKISWPTLVLFGGALCLGEVVQKTHVAHLVAKALADVFSSNLLAGVFLTILVSVLFTELMSNTALTALFAPILLDVAHSTGTSPELLLIPCAIASSYAFALPVATPPNALAFATRLVSRKTMLRFGMLLNLVGIAILFLLLGFVLR